MPVATFFFVFFLGALLRAADGAPEGLGDV
jgi:hypothetical protein